MECEAEDKTGNLRLSCLLVFEPGKPHENVSNHAMLMGGRFIIAPMECRTSPPGNEQTAGSTHGMIVTMEIDPG